MPELFVIGAVGAFVTFLLANLNLYFIHKSFFDPKLKILNSNLVKIKWYWSIEQGAPIALDVDQSIDYVMQRDYQKATRGAFLFGTMMLFLSWLGFFILSLYMVSMYKLAKNREEEKIMASDLAKFEINDNVELKRLLQEKANIIL